MQVDAMRAADYEASPEVRSKSRCVQKNFYKSCTIFLLIISIIFIGLFAAYFVKYEELQRMALAPPPKKEVDTLPKREESPPSFSVLGKYMYNSVAADQTVCSQIGSNILNTLNGNAVDAAIASILCTGIISCYSNGLGGGGFAVVYNRTEKRSYTLDFRERAPASSTENMFVNLPDEASLIGGLAIATPGEVAGLHKLWQKFGSLPWSTLIEPNIQVLQQGFRVPKNLVGAMQYTLQQMTAHNMTELKDFITNPKTGEIYKEGDLLINAKLAETFKKIAENVTDFYQGDIAATIVEEIKSEGGRVTADDLKNYEATWRTALSVKLRNSMTLHSMPPPSSGAIVSYILNIIDGYQYTSSDRKDDKSNILYFHRLMEVFKFAFGRRSALGDSDFVNMTSEVQNLTSRSFADATRAKITDDRTHDLKYYNPSFMLTQDDGTAHLSVIDSQGNAVAMTTTINLFFGSLVRGNKTGIIYNNEMDDFSTPNKTNAFGLPPSPSNFIKPLKRPMSSMSPLIVTDANGDVVLCTGAAGGSRIISAVAQTSLDVIYFNKTVKEAIDYPRLHHQLLPDIIQTHVACPMYIQDGLRKLGHKFEFHTYLSIMSSISRSNGSLYANCDFRRGASPSGL